MWPHWVFYKLKQIIPVHGGTFSLTGAGSCPPEDMLSSSSGIIHVEDCAAKCSKTKACSFISQATGTSACNLYKGACYTQTAGAFLTFGRDRSASKEGCPMKLTAMYGILPGTPLVVYAEKTPVWGSVQFTSLLATKKRGDRMIADGAPLRDTSGHVVVPVRPTGVIDLSDFVTEEVQNLTRNPDQVPAYVKSLLQDQGQPFPKVLDLSQREALLKGILVGMPFVTKEQAPVWRQADSMQLLTTFHIGTKGVYAGSIVKSKISARGYACPVQVNGAVGWISEKSLYLDYSLINDARQKLGLGPGPK